MVKIFVTGDNHFGKPCNSYPEIKEKLIQSRFECLKEMINKAELDACELFVVTGDLFDKINIKVGDVKQVVDILAAFSGSVIVLPGNHDYYTGSEKVWKDFENALASRDHDITLLKEFKPYTFSTGEETVVVYPAFCHAKHSEENNLNWIKNADIQKAGVINIGIAHGAIKGVTPDNNQEYFLMTENELLGIPVDAWLIGHTHIPYPDVLDENNDTAGYKIFNAGTHEQTDLSNRTEGNGFIITIDKQGAIAQVLARKYVSGKVHFYDLEIPVKADSDTTLADALRNKLDGKDKNSVVRVKVSGTIKQSEYQNKEKIYKDILGEYLTYRKEDNELSEEITVEKIRTEFAETSFAAQFMEELIKNPTELQMLYQLLQDCREN